ncbi:YhgE/Pip family protein [Microbacterium sp. cx-55]|uniref:YhgE/Pip family protein n=1 Tax=unclassified Microbacterium TaxID=2609290 RepID=UPI001CBF1F2E|nr:MULTISPECIES: YhgE/Pip family protein [unclassified Microbacterium]MBZ4487236.1 YhgE/Pip family protein [Microbacterium sp. cx-55]MCC4908646.1 YhgE/Pip family protein [Microbacterium sp. cx-59]UGB35260.1 YhgE/Pip family protein [Microbacterium sp. cx-55]
MKIPAMIVAELRRLTSTRMSVIALIALMCVPVLYGGLYLWANQDPYGRLDQVPVALVVADEGETATDGTVTNYGDQVADKLVEDGAFDWQRMSASGAADALAHGAVDFTVTIPTDFSDALASASGTSPRQATLSLATNDANNYLASTIGSQAIEKIRSSVATLVGDQAALQLLTAISDIRGNLVTAADGAATLADGTHTALDGANTLGAGATQLADGTATLASGAGSVSSGAAQVSSGAQQVAAGTATLDGYADRAGAAAQSAADALPEIRTALSDEMAAQGLTPDEIAAVLARLDPLASRIQSANGTVQGAVARVDQLASGAAQVASGAAQVADGAAQVASGAESAASGAAQLRDGTGTLASGLSQLDDGAGTLRDGLTDGVAQIPDSDETLRTDQASTISDPVQIESSKVAAAADYGAGLAPFFASLAGWIGIYALFLIVKPISRRAITALHSPIRITLAGWLTPGLLGGVQMIALFGILAVTLGFTFANPLATLGIMVLASLTYAAIILALNVWLGSVGQFLGLVLMVLQLVTAGGTFPWQTLPVPLTNLHHVLPMGFVVDAMRQLMYGGDISRIGGDIFVLMAWMLGALAFAAIGVTRMTHHRTLRDLAPSLIG